VTNSMHASYASSYGNPSLVPLIGGSGGGAWNYSGGGGGGAILIAAASTMAVGGSITANGGSGSYSDGSGGGIRLVANSLGGNGSLTALTYSGSLSASTIGRIRLEANSVTGSLAPLPQTIAVSPVLNPVTNTVVLWPSDTAPSVRIISVDTSNVPADPKANLDVSADVGVVVNGTATVTVQTNNFGGVLPTVKVRSAGKFSANAVTTTATFVSGNGTQATWTVSVNFVAGFTTLQAIATVP
jgi:hypothetical protein